MRLILNALGENVHAVQVCRRVSRDRRYAAKALFANLPRRACRVSPFLNLDVRIGAQELHALLQRYRLTNHRVNVRQRLTWKRYQVMSNPNVDLANDRQR